MTIAIALYIETIDEYAGAPGQISLVQAWAEADREPGLRELPAYAGAILELMLAGAGAPRPSVPVTPGPAGAVEPAGAISTA